MKEKLPFFNEYKHKNISKRLSFSLIFQKLKEPCTITKIMIKHVQNFNTAFPQGMVKTIEAMNRNSLTVKMRVEAINLNRSNGLHCITSQLFINYAGVA